MDKEKKHDKSGKGSSKQEKKPKSISI